MPFVCQTCGRVEDEPDECCGQPMSKEEVVDMDEDEDDYEEDESEDEEEF